MVPGWQGKMETVVDTLVEDDPVLDKVWRNEFWWKKQTPILFDHKCDWISSKKCLIGATKSVEEKLPLSNKYGRGNGRNLHMFWKEFNRLFQHVCHIVASRLIKNSRLVLPQWLHLLIHGPKQGDFVYFSPSELKTLSSLKGETWCIRKHYPSRLDQEKLDVKTNYILEYIVFEESHSTDFEEN